MLYIRYLLEALEGKSNMENVFFSSAKYSFLNLCYQKFTVENETREKRVVHFQTGVE